MTQIDLAERQERLRMIKDSVSSIVPKDGDMTRIRKIRFTETGIDRQLWQQIGEMGWLGIRLSEEQGGIGLGMLEYVTLIEALGAGIIPEPIIDAVFVAGLLPDEQRQQQLSGEQLILPAGFNYQHTSALTINNDKLQGVVENVHLANAADGYLVFTQQGLALVARKEAAVSVQQTQDGGHLGCLRFNNAPVQLIKSDTEQIERLLDEAALATAAYLLGGMQTAFEITLAYLKIRRQFNSEIGSFQVLQHNAVDLKIQIELTRAILGQAANNIDQADKPTVCQQAVSTAKIRATTAALLVTRKAIQLHGAIGYTDEADIGLFLRKALVLINNYGSVDYHRQRYIQLTYNNNEVA